MLSGTGSPQKYVMFLWGKESKHPLVVPIKLRGDFMGADTPSLRTYVYPACSAMSLGQTLRYKS